MSALQDLDAERAVLGCALQGGDTELLRSLTPADFAAPAHQQIFSAIGALMAVGQPADTLTVSTRLRASGHLDSVGGPAYLMQLDQSVPLVSNLASYVSLVRDRSRRRQLVDNARQIAARASNLSEDVSGVALDGSAALASLGAAGAVELETMEHAIGDLLDELGQVQSGEKQMAFPTGIAIWDELLGGIPAGYLTLIGAQPSVGKSALKGTIIRNMARAGIKVGTFELEDPAKALAKRYVASGSGVPVRRLGRERLPQFAMDSVAHAVNGAYQWAGNIIKDERTGLTAAQVAATARQMIVQRGCRVLFIDHATELKFDAGLGRYDLDVAAGIRQIRDVAKSMDVAVICLAHFHRPKTNTDKEPRNIRPTSAMWRDAGVFEQSSRVAVGLWLDEENSDGIMATVLKQSEGEKDFDFWMPMEASAGLVASEGGRKREGTKGYTTTEAA